MSFLAEFEVAVTTFLTGTVATAAAGVRNAGTLTSPEMLSNGSNSRRKSR